MVADNSSAREQLTFGYVVFRFLYNLKSVARWESIFRKELIGTISDIEYSIVTIIYKANHKKMQYIK